MAIRVTPQLSASQLTRQLTVHSAKIARLQEQISNGVRINRPSDDPLGIKEIVSRQQLLGRYEAERRTLSSARDRLNQANTELLSIEDLLVEAKTLASQARSSLDETERHSLARDIDSILTQLQDSANTQFSGDYLFAGDAVRTAPYPADSPQAIYAGSTATLSLNVSGRSSLSVLYSGDDIFGTRARSTTFYAGSTGAKPGTGTDSSTNLGQLTVRHTATTFAAGSGVTAGASSASGDNILGPSGSHTLTIQDTSGTGASGTVSINGGAPVNFTSADTDLAVPGPNGELVHLNLSAITPGFNGDIALAGEGTLSLDGGVTTVAIDFSGNQSVTDPSGRQTFVNSTDIRRAGTEELEYLGTSDLFQALAGLRDDLLNTRNRSSSDGQDSLTRRVTEIDRHHQNLYNVIGNQAQTLKTIEDLDDRIEDLTLDTQERLSQIAATDIPASAVELQEAQNLLQFTYAVTAQLFQTSLLDYIA